MWSSKAVGSGLIFGVATAVMSVAAASQKAKKIDGAQVFAAKCASCHGSKGQGGGGYPHPLTGSKSLDDLTAFIKKSMPPGSTRLPTGEGSAVASSIYNAFYSPLAQEKNRPARVTLSRLTVKQFRNALADLVGPTHYSAPFEAGTGLTAQYFKGRDIDAKMKALDRLDPQVDFNFGMGTPAPDKFEPHTFSATWNGSVLAPESGEYEFIVHTDRSVQLYLNGPKPIIDAWLKSGTDTEFRAAVHLLGGRLYPLYMQFSKANTGVDDSKEIVKKPIGNAFISLHWKRPLHTEEVIPTRCLYTTGAAATYIPTTPFPPDDRSTGYERGNEVNKGWDDATTAAALETADYLVKHLTEVSGVPENAKDRKERLLDYCRKFDERAFRRPLDAATQETYIEKQFRVAPDLEMAVKRVVILAIKSPRFLYREIAGANDDYGIASQLSFGLWDTLPDEQLNRAAMSGELKTREGIERQANRMVYDSRAWNKLKEFLLLWLKVDEVPDIAKNKEHFPGFDAATVSDLRTSLELFLQSTAWSKSSDYRDLILSQNVFLNGRLAKLYGQSLPADAPFQASQPDPATRAGVLTQPYLLSRFAYQDGSSPIHRGVLIVRSLLGRTLNPPPAAFTPLPASLHPDMTTRERVALQTKPEMCNACHGIINPLGFTLERFDAIGRLREQDNRKPVDSSGNYKTRKGDVAKFSNAVDLAHYIADSGEAHAAFVEKLFQHLTKQPALAYGAQTVPDLQSAFEKGNYSIRSLMVQIMLATTKR